MRLIEHRIGLLFAGFLLCFLVIVSRAFWLQGVQGSQLSSQAISQQTEPVITPGLRGSLLDRRGNKLASSEDAATIYATPYQVKNPPQAAAKLAPILGMSEGEVLSALTEESGFSYLAHKVDLATAAKVERLELEGIGESPDTRRTYPQGDMAGQVIGSVGSENQGLIGLEAGEESVLAGTDGERRVVTDALGDPIRQETVKETSDGENVQLTLDPVIQQKTEQVLQGVGETYSPTNATAIVVDPRTSQILAMANWPPVDPADLSGAVGAVEIGLRVGATKFSKWIDKFGFGRKTGIQFPGEEEGIVPSLDQYSGSTMGNLPIGQGLAVTPIQMVAGYTAIANNGWLRPPQLITRVGEEKVHEPRGKRVLKPEVTAELREMLEGVFMSGGTASAVTVPGYSLAGKTGTAQVAENGGYSETRYIASFIGFAPAMHPKFLAAVIVNEPQGEIYGGSVAAPAFGQIAEFALPYLGVPQE